MDVFLDPTLGCGQAHRWIKKDGSWEGVIDNKVVTLTQTEDGFECSGTSNLKMILDYFCADDDINVIYEDISKRDPYVASIIRRCHGMRILKQEPWECIATYLLATNANVKRIKTMVESICKEFGKSLGRRYSFPTPEEIINKEDKICNCKLGYRNSRFIELAHIIHDGDLDPYAIAEMSYDECIKTLLTINGVGPKVADCIALFAYRHLSAFPIDARIKKILDDVYGQRGNYSKLSIFGKEKFGRYAGYAQEFLYHVNFI